MILVDDANSQPVSMIDIPPNSLVKMILDNASVSELPNSSITVEEARQTIASTTADRNVIRAQGDRLKGSQRCQDSTECDAKRDIDNAGCDAIFDYAAGDAVLITGAGAGIGGLVGGLPGVVIGGTVSGSLAASWLYFAANRKQQCKVRAVVAWAACVMSC